MIIPSIDLMGGKAVQLRQGKEKVLEREDVFDLAREFSKYGEIAVIDLDAALGNGDNLELIKELCNSFDCRVGGGIRDLAKANQILGFGAKKIIIGTKANGDFLKNLPKERIIVAVDVKDGIVVDKGWMNNTGRKPEELIKDIEDYCSELLFTNVDVEGMMKGADFEMIRKIASSTKNKITVAGGISSLEEIKLIEGLGLNSQLGMALYTGNIRLEDTFVSLLDFKDGLIPTIVQDEGKNVLMMAFSSKESLFKTFNSGKCTYFSRSRKKLWTKGETSGNFQELLKARYDCDRDALLFIVRQKGVACHSGTYSCFGDREFSLDRLYSKLKERVDNPRIGSYTSNISKDEDSIKAKIKEEASEVVRYKDRDNLIWEIADLTYFVMVLMAKKGITIDEVKNELWRRER